MAWLPFQKIVLERNRREGMKKENKDRNKMTKIGDFQVKQTFYLYPISLSLTHTQTHKEIRIAMGCVPKRYI